jgi:hypothetical protein
LRRQSRIRRRPVVSSASTTYVGMDTAKKSVQVAMLLPERDGGRDRARARRLHLGDALPAGVNGAQRTATCVGRSPAASESSGMNGSSGGLGARKSGHARPWTEIRAQDARKSGHARPWAEIRAKVARKSGHARLDHGWRFERQRPGDSYASSRSPVGVEATAMNRGAPATGTLLRVSLLAASA